MLDKVKDGGLLRSGQEEWLRSGTIRKVLPVGRTYTHTHQGGHLHLHLPCWNFEKAQSPYALVIPNCSNFMPL